MPPINSMKTWKIILLIILGLLVLFTCFVFYNNYQSSKLFENSKDMRGIVFGSDWFDDELKTCNVAYSNGWKILGIENSECTISFIWDNEVDYKEGTITHNWTVCELPYEVYSNADRIEWSELVDSEYCN